MPRNEHLEWRVKYAPGKLSAKGYDAAGQVMATDAVETTGPAAASALNTERPVLLADGEDLAPVKVEVLDAQDRVVPTADDRVTFQVTGAGAWREWATAIRAIMIPIRRAFATPSMACAWSYCEPVKCLAKFI